MRVIDSRDREEAPHTAYRCILMYAVCKWQEKDEACTFVSTHIHMRFNMYRDREWTG